MSRCAVATSAPLCHGQDKPFRFYLENENRHKNLYEFFTQLGREAQSNNVHGQFSELAAKMLGKPVDACYAPHKIERFGACLGGQRFDRGLFCPHELEGVPCSSITVTLFTDQAGRDCYARLYLMNEMQAQIAAQKAQQGAPQEPEQASPLVNSLQITAHLPLVVSQAQLNPLSHLCLELSPLLPLGHLGVNAREGVYHRYGWLCEEDEPDAHVVVEVLSVMETCLLQLAPLFYAYLEAGRSLQEILAGVQAKLQTAGAVR